MCAAARHPPAFQIEVGPQPLLQGLIALLCLLAAASLLAACASHFPVAWWLAPLLPAAAWLGWLQARVQARQLQWDGQVWRLAPAGRAPDTADAAEVQIAVVMDLDAFLLLRCRPAAVRLLPRHVYLPLSRTALGASWGHLRATLYSARPGRHARP
mgnify:CR=1 FL=1